jgi:hypothetical protein
MSQHCAEADCSDHHAAGRLLLNDRLSSLYSDVSLSISPLTGRRAIPPFRCRHKWPKSGSSDNITTSDDGRGDNQPYLLSRLQRERHELPALVQAAIGPARARHLPSMYYHRGATAPPKPQPRMSPAIGRNPEITGEISHMYSSHTTSGSPQGRR